MIVAGYRRTWQVEALEELQIALASRDGKGGAIFWLADGPETFPQLAVRISGESADIHYFREDGHAGFRCLGGQGLPEGGMTTLLYEGSDPSSGEDTPNEFVVTLQTVWQVAKEFFLSKRMSGSVFWSELQ